MSDKKLTIKIDAKPILVQLNAIIEVNVGNQRRMDDVVHLCNIEWDRFQLMLELLSEHDEKQKK